MAKLKSHTAKGKSHQIRADRHHQTTPNGHSNGTNSGDSISVVQAVARLGVSVSTIKRMCHDGELEWFRTRGPNGHIRILAESIERVRQGHKATSVSATVTPSTVTPTPAATERETNELLQEQLKGLRIRRQLKELNEADAEDERRAIEALRTERSVAKAKEAVAELQQRCMDEADQARWRAQTRLDWERAWLAAAAKKFPQWISFEQEQAVTSALQARLARFDVSSSDQLVSIDLGRVFDRVVAPWIAEREFRQKVQNIFESCSWPRWFPYGTTENERLSAVAAAHPCLELIPTAATEAEIRAVINDVFAPYKKQIQERLNREAAEAEAARAQESAKWKGIIQKAIDDGQKEKDVAQRKKRINNLVEQGQEFVDSYVQQLYDNGNIDRNARDDSAWQDDLRAQVRQRIEAEFDGNDIEVDAERVARAIVDADLGVQDGEFDED
jgi:hypothetical protein